MSEQALAEAIVAEQAFLDTATARREELVGELRRALAGPADLRDAAQSGVDVSRRRRLAALTAAADSLVLGRLDTATDTHRIGRIGLGDSGGDPLLLDWRAPAARPFYTATALDPAGVQRRRHIRTDGARVVGVDDEVFHTGEGAADEPLVGEAALIAALDAGRTGRMGTAVATLQTEQDAIVRASADGPLLVQGGPGTGKTVVALHRAAYLLFTRPDLAARGVLVLGPSQRFCDYISQVLPALGETAVVSATPTSLLPGVEVERQESRQVAEIKGRACWQRSIQGWVAELVPLPTDLALALDGETHVIPAGRAGRAVTAALAGGRSHHRAREHAFAHLRDALVTVILASAAETLVAVEEGLEDILGTVDRALARNDDRGVSTATGSAVDGELTEAEIERLRERVGSDRAIAAALSAWWPVRDPAAELTSMLSDGPRLRRLAPELGEAEIALVVGEPAAPGAISGSDIALLDAMAHALGAPEEPAGADEGFVADRAGADRSWTYGHVVVDEAQELSPMQWQMVLRRCPTRSVTAVGDIDQTEAPHAHTTWADALGPVLGDRWRRADLTICYRTPAEVMALTPPVLAAAGSTSTPARSVRSTGREPREVATTAEALVTEVMHQASVLETAHPSGTVGIVTATAHLDALRAAVPEHLTLTPAAEAKGLEWDAVVVVDPEAISAEPRGWNALYVALTRCTQDLVQVRRQTIRG